MSRDLNSVLAALLSEPALRAEFRRDPRAFARELSEEQQEELLSLSPDELDLQGEALVAKRRHEVAQLAPATFARLGSAAAERFACYAATHWPRGHRRHVADAAAFLEFLDARGPRPWRFELARLRFVLGRRRFAMHRARIPVPGGERAVLQVLVRTRRGVREALLGFAGLRGEQERTPRPESSATT